ncbi:MAG: zinc ribbon domain-containing protein [Myxococcota bacterium]|jgi:hypothetical protein|nr:zinc ribbon domain-containing protein [Myxococcota bacterium]
MQPSLISFLLLLGSLGGLGWLVWRAGQRVRTLHEPATEVGSPADGRALAEEQAALTAALGELQASEALGHLEGGDEAAIAAALAAPLQELQVREEQARQAECRRRRVLDELARRVGDLTPAAPAVVPAPVAAAASGQRPRSGGGKSAGAGMEKKSSCPGCGRDLRPADRFCQGCGRPVAESCPGCGSPLASTARFCKRCGHRVR